MGVGVGEVDRPLRNTCWQFLRKLNVDFPYSPGIPLLRNYSRELRTCVLKKTCVQMSVVALFKIMSHSSVTVSAVTDRPAVCVRPMGLCLAIKGNKGPRHTMTCVDLAVNHIVLGEKSQIQMLETIWLHLWDLLKQSQQ